MGEGYPPPPNCCVLCVISNKQINKYYLKKAVHFKLNIDILSKQWYNLIK